MNETIKSDYVQRIEKAVEFIENNLKNKLPVDLIAEKACFSKYHFIRVFTTMTGETVGSYVRRRRISRSSVDLISSSRSILSIAMDYQFESQEAYTRSFKRVYHTTPGMYRKHNVHQIAYGRSKLSVSRLRHLKSNITMEPKIVEVPERKLVGLRTKTSLANNRIPELWIQFMARMNEIRDDQHTGYYEVHPYDPDFRMEDFTETMEFEKWAAVEVNDPKSVPDGMEVHTLSGGKYAIFIHKGSWPMSRCHLTMPMAHG